MKLANVLKLRHYAFSTLCGVFIAIALSLVAHNIQYGPQAALIAEAFPPPVRDG